METMRLSEALAACWKERRATMIAVQGDTVYMMERQRDRLVIYEDNHICLHTPPDLIWIRSKDLPVLVGTYLHVNRADGQGSYYLEITRAEFYSDIAYSVKEAPATEASTPIGVPLAHFINHANLIRRCTEEETDLLQRGRTPGNYEDNDLFIHPNKEQVLRWQDIKGAHNLFTDWVFLCYAEDRQDN